MGLHSVASRSFRPQQLWWILEKYCLSARHFWGLRSLERCLESFDIYLSWFELNLIVEKMFANIAKSSRWSNFRKLLNNSCIYVYVKILNIMYNIPNNCVIFVLWSLINFAEELCWACHLEFWYPSGLSWRASNSPLVEYYVSLVVRKAYCKGFEMSTINSSHITLVYF